MKKIVLALVVAVVACVVVFASQDAKCRQAAVYSLFYILLAHTDRGRVLR